MALRRSSKTRMRFWGCADYPQCDGTLGIKEDGTAEGDDDLFSLYDEDDHDEQD
jgi:ssDNA-binding Zn-finger/Zn-ribbon topoisomerase 1